MTQPQFSGAGSILLNARRSDLREHLLAAGMRLKYAKDAEREAISIPDDYEGFLRTLWPGYLSDKSGKSVPLADYHHDFWRWAWQIALGSRNRPFVAIWPRNGGKCYAFDTEVVLIDGKRRAIRDLSVGDFVMSFNETSGRMEPKPISKMWDSGTKSCLKLRTRTGKSVELTPEHALLSFEGWVIARDLRVGDRVASPRRCPVEVGECRSDEEVRLLAYMIAEGGITGHACNFTNADDGVVQDFQRCAESMGFWATYRTRYRWDLMGPREGAQRIGTLSSAPRKWLANSGLLGCSSLTKRLPAWVYGLSQRQKWQFLGAMIDTDGWIQGERGRIGITLANPKLIEDLAYLFMQVGVVCTVHHKENGHAGAWELRVDLEGVETCATNLTLRAKHVQLQQAAGRSRCSLIDTYPQEVARGLPFGINRMIRDEHRIRAGTPYAVTRPKLRRMIDVYPSARWQWLEQADVFWDEIVAIEDAGDKATFDLEIVGNHNLVAGGLIGHNSTNSELLCAASAVRETRRYALYVCHESGTEICDPDLGWMVVDDHPTAKERHGESGYSVKIAGIPWVEVVTREHRYWGLRQARRDHGHARGKEIMRTPPAWIEARHIDWNTWLGLPIDCIVEDVSPSMTRYSYSRKEYIEHRFAPLDDPEFWWAVGLWWGDGTLGGERGAQISWSCADAHPDISTRLIALLEKHGYSPRVRQKRSACHDVTICDSILARWLNTWKVGRNRKTPPAFVERLPLVKQAGLLRGYFDADGHAYEHTARLTSIHLPGLMSARRMLLRLGVVPALAKRRQPRQSTMVDGRTYEVQQTYDLYVRDGAEALGYSLTPHSEDVRDLFIADGHLWSRVKEIDVCGGATFVAITTSTGDYTTHFARSHNCRTQERADDHVATVAHMLEAAEVARANPSAANRMLGKYGNALAWRRSRLRTASRFTLDAIGLDVMARGAKIDEDRPDLLIFDDIDDEQDSVATVEKKIKTLTHAILPAGSEDAAILFVQNLVHPDSIASRLVDGRADFLALRRVSGPHKALRGMTFEQREGRFVITGGEPTWPAMGIARCQEEVDEIGMSAFLSELQHEVDVPPGGMYDHIVWRHIRWDEVPWGSLTDICVWVDPAVTDTDDSDAHGIQADARHSDGTIYRLYSWEDRTSPEDSLMRAILKAIELGASRVGVETDQGGDVWRTSYEQSWTLLTAPEPNGSDSRLLQRRAEFVSLRDTMLRERGQLVKKPAFVWDKAGAGYGGKVHRSAQMLADYERGHIIHVVGTHEILERALRRFPKTKPLDLADAAFWSWKDLQKTVSVWAA